jgi:hypothetical protein
MIVSLVCPMRIHIFRVVNGTLPDVHVVYLPDLIADRLIVRERL